MRIDHINIKGPERLLQRVRDFYCEVLGLKEGFRHGVEYRGNYIEEFDLTQLFLRDPSGTGLEVNCKGEVPA